MTSMLEEELNQLIDRTLPLLRKSKTFIVLDETLSIVRDPKASARRLIRYNGELLINELLKHI